MPTKINIQGATQNADKLVLVIGGGYDATQDAPISSTDSVGNSIYFVDSLSGNLLWRGSKAGATKNFALAGKSMDYSIPSDVRVLDFNADGFADRMYAADMGGQVWRFDIFNGQPAASLVNGGVIAQLGAAGAALPTLDDTRRFYYAPDVAYVSERDYGFLHVGIGSGYRAHPNESANHNRFYALRDYRTFSPMTQAEYDALTPTRDADLVDVTTDTSALVPQGSPGWRFELSDGGWLGEKVLAETRTFNNKVYVTTFRPGSSGSGCQPALGTNRQYVMSLFNGSPIRRDEWVGPPPPETIFIFDPECDGDCDNDPVPPPPDPNDPPGGSGISSGVGTGFQSEDDLGFPVRTFWAEENIE
jgi:type IV pilus assembly protein PilY1